MRVSSPYCAVSLACMAVAGLSNSQAFAQKCQTTPPPRGSIVLFDGQDTSKWLRTNGQPCPWKIVDGAMVAQEAGIASKQEFGDHRLHLEFWIPPRSRPNMRGNGNSGLYVHGFYELQILDSRGISPPNKKESCGAIYEQAAPMSDAALPAGQWQSMDVYAHAPRVEAGKQVAPVQMTVYLNGARILDNVKAEPTPGSLPMERFKSTGPVMLQYHAHPVRFRNIWVQPLKEFRAPVSESPERLRLNLTDRIPLDFVFIRAGNFDMGSAEDTLDRGIDEQMHQVTLIKDYWLGKYEVTNRQFRVFRPDHVSRALGGEKGDFNGDDQPVVAVALADVEAFLRWASAQANRTLRLPTEAEWEHACRAGSPGRYCFGDDPALLGDYAWYAGNSGWVTHPVGRKKPNSWGLYDMHGNVAEWVSDWYTYYPGGAQTDPKGPAYGAEHAWRECSWSSKPYECRCSQRDRAAPHYKSAALGFRVLCEP